VEGGSQRRVLPALDGNASGFRTLRAGGVVIQEEAQLWRERYRVLFDRNVAGIILTTPDGRIMDCNETCVRIFEFDSREEMLAHSAWDLYFNKSEREGLLDRLRTPGNNPAEEVCLRARDGAPIWILARRAVASYVNGVPALLQGTFIDITAQKKAGARLRDIKGGHHRLRCRKAKSPGSLTCPNR
jgi:PAS domain S-box-containing protein